MTKPSKKKSSEIWSYFSEVEDGLTECGYCSQTLSVRRGCMGNLFRHMRVKHPELQVKSQREIHSITSTAKNISPNSLDHTTGLFSAQDGRKTSTIWTHFSKLETGPGSSCNYCSKILKSGMSNLHRHMKKKHPDISVKSIEFPKALVSNMYIPTSPSLPKGPVFRGPLKRSIRMKKSSSLGRRKSTVWNHFTELNSVAHCNHCRRAISCKAGGTGNLIRHLRMRHPSVDVKLPPSRDSIFDNSITNNDDDVNNEHLPTDPKIIIEEYVEIDVPFYAESLPHQSIEQKPATNIVNTIPIERDDFMQVNRILSNTHIDVELIKLLVKQYHSLSLVEEPYFISFVKSLNSKYNLPSIKALSKNIIPKMYSETYDFVKNVVTKASAVCLTLEKWTSVDNETFMAMTAHFVNENTKMSSNLLEIIALPEEQTPEILTTLIQSKIEEWNLSKKISAIVSDEEELMVEAVHLGGWTHLVCFAHSIDSMVHLALDEISSLLIRVRSLIDFFKNDEFALCKLQEMQIHMGLPSLNLKGDTPERWNSTYDMLVRTMQMKDPIISTLSEVDSLSDYGIDWDFLEQTIHILSIFNQITFDMNSDNNVTLSKLMTYCTAMDQHINNQPISNSYSELSTLISVLRKQIEKRFRDIDNFGVIAEATVLDPRFKKIPFTDLNKFDILISEIKTKVSSVMESSKLHRYKVQQSTSYTNRQSELNDLWSNHDNKYSKYQSDVVFNTSSAASVEVNQYLEEELLYRASNPLDWWKKKKYKYPNIYKLAERVLCAMATCVPCARIYSKTGFALLLKRSQLLSHNLQEVLFLDCNLGNV